MTPALAALLLGGILVVAGFQGRSVLDVALGRPKPADQGGGQSDPTALPDLTPLPTTGLPHGTATFDGLPVAKWIIPRLTWARNNDYWHGQVTSGWRDPNRKITPSPGMPVAAQGQSNHRGTVYPLGAVDVSDADGLENAMRHYPGFPKLKRGTAIGDPIHFSATGR